MLIPMSTGLVQGVGAAALEYVGGFTFDDSASSSTSSTNSYDGNLTGGIDTHVQEGDLVLAAVAFNQSFDTGISNSDGFTELADLYQNDINDINLGVYSKVMGGSPDTSITFTFSSSAFPISAVMVFRGVDTGTPVGAVGTNTQSNTGQPDPPSRTIPSGGLYFCAGAAASKPLNGGISDFTASDMDEMVTLSTDFAALGLGYSFTNSNAAQFGGGTTSIASSSASMAVGVNKG